MMDGIDTRLARPYIERLRHDPRAHAIVQGWAVQVSMLVGERYRSRDVSPDQIAHEAAEEAIRLAMAFLLDNDGEYRAVCEERDRLLEQAIRGLELAPPTVIVRTA